MISVVVPSYRRPDALRACLIGLQAQSLKPADIVVVLRTGDQESADVVDTTASSLVRAVFVGEPGVLAAMRAGVLSCAGTAVAFIDDDAVPPPDWLARLVNRMEHGVGAVGGRDRVFHDQAVARSDVGRVTPWGKVVGNHHLGTGGPRDVDVLKGVNMAIRRDAIAIPSGLKGQGAQRHFEVAMLLHVRDAGWRVVYDSNIVVDHYPAERHDNDRRGRPDRAAIRAGAYNLVIGLLTFRRPLVWRRAFYGLAVGDRDAPGIVRGGAALLRGELDVARALLPSLWGQVEALYQILRGRRLRMVTVPPVPSCGK